MKIEVTQDVRDHVDLIDKQYREAKRDKLSRFSVEWGRWSREMNLELHRKIQAASPQQILYKYVFIYWTLKSQLLEVWFKFPWRSLKMNLKKRLGKQILDTKKMILSGDVPAAEFTEEDLKRALLESNK